VPSCFTSVNHNKRSLVLDLTVAEGVAPARELVSRADIVVDDVRPGIMEKLGLGYDTLREIKRVLFYGAITGFGGDGGADVPGQDLLVRAGSGLMSIAGPEPGHPTKVGVAVIDVLAGLHALPWYGILTSVGTPAGPINDMGETFTFSEKLGLSATVAVPGSRTPQVANPVPLTVTPPQYRCAPPRLRQDTLP